MNCTTCGSNLLCCHKLIDDTVSPMKNKSNIIYPKCSVCGRPIQIEDVEANITGEMKVLIMSGTAGAGKTACTKPIDVACSLSRIALLGNNCRVGHTGLWLS